MTTLGRTSRRFKALAAELRAHGQARRIPCCLCHQPIDYDLPHPDPNSFSVQHIKDWHTHPHLREDPTNLAPAHLGCNSSANQGTPPPDHGNTSQNW